MLLLNKSKQTSNGNRVVKGAAIMFVGIKRDFKPAPKVGGVEWLLMEHTHGRRLCAMMSKTHGIGSQMKNDMKQPTDGRRPEHLFFAASFEHNAPQPLAA